MFAASNKNGNLKTLIIIYQWKMLLRNHKLLFLKFCVNLMHAQQLINEEY